MVNTSILPVGNNLFVSKIYEPMGDFILASITVYLLELTQFKMATTATMVIFHSCSFTDTDLKFDSVIAESHSYIGYLNEILHYDMRLSITSLMQHAFL